MTRATVVCDRDSLGELGSWKDFKDKTQLNFGTSQVKSNSVLKSKTSGGLPRVDGAILQLIDEGNTVPHSQPLLLFLLTHTACSQSMTKNVSRLVGVTQGLEEGWASAKSDGRS